MRVLQLGKFYPPAKGGMETILALICERTAQHVKNRVIVANSKPATVEEHHGSIEVLRVAALTRIGAVTICPKMPFELARESADVIVLHEPNPMALVAYFLARPTGRLVVWYHSDVIRPSWIYRLFYRPFLRFALSRAVRIVVSSPALAASAPELKDFQAKCSVIPFGVEGSSHDESAAVLHRAAAIRREIDQPIVLFVGRLVPYKGVDVLLDALTGMQATALIVGEGPQRSALEAQARQLGIASRVKFLGAVPDQELAALYRGCDVFVLPSVTRQEAFGVVQLEAMAASKPVISTDVGTGVGWVNRNGETGYVVPPRDPVALREALRRLLADTGLQQSMGDAARRRVRSSFSVERMIDDTLALYRDVTIGDRRSAEDVGRWTRGGMAKRLLDIILSGSGLVVSAPLWAAIAALIKLEDGGPVFFSQERVGHRGGRFEALKFRSMIVDAERRTGPIQAGENDPRVTRVGRILRATAMDELPQLWNIFRGDMSFVGPRALRPGEIEVKGNGAVEKLEDVPGFSDRCAVRPGLTGVAQIYAPRDVVRRRKFRYDRFYIRRQSFLFDVRLILVSFWITFLGRWEVRSRKL